MAGSFARGRGGSVVVLAYHNVVPDGTRAGDRSLHLPLSAFVAQLDALGDTHRVIPIDDIATPPDDRPAVIITFDDAYRGCIDLALPELVSRGMPATVFVAPDRLADRFWWDDLAGPGGLDPDVRTHAIEALAGEDRAVREWAAARAYPRGAPHPEPWLEAAPETRLAESSTLAGIQYGSHSWSHRTLTRLEDEDLANDLSRSARWLGRFPNYTPWLAYPYGLWDRRVETAARSAGYRGALDLSGGRVAAGAEAFTQPRSNIPAGVSVDGFRLRAHGILRR